MLTISGAPWWLNWLVIYPTTAVCALTAVVMIALMVYGLTVKSRDLRGGETNDCRSEEKPIV